MKNSAIKTTQKSTKKRAAVISSSNISKTKHWIYSFLPSKRIEYILLALVLIAGLGTLIYEYLPITRLETISKDMPFITEYVDDSSLELSVQQTRINGENGIKDITYRVKHKISGKEISRVVINEHTVKSPINRIIAQGKKQYRFMWCSDGSYRYYDNINSGFTHQSKDYCSSSSHGHMTNLSDSAPAQQYTTPAPRIYLPTTCNTQVHTYGGFFDPSATTTCF